MSPFFKEDREEQSQNEYRASVAPQALELLEDSLVFPGCVLTPVSVRENGIPGTPNRPWTRLRPQLFFDSGLPALYSIAFRKEAPDAVRRSLRARRTLFDGFLQAAAERIGRRTTMAEQAVSRQLDAAESQIALGKPVYKATVLAGFFSPREQPALGESVRRSVEGLLRAGGLIPQRLMYIPERALMHFQPGGHLFPGLDEATLLIDELLPLLPRPERRVPPASDAVWLGRHARNGRDVYFSYKYGLDPSKEPPPHAISLILGEMGSRKTTLMRWMMLQRLLQGHTVISLDPEGENDKLCDAVGGTVIPAGVPENNDTCLLHPLHADTPADMLLAARFLVSAIGGSAALTPGITAALHDAVQRRWKRKPNRPMMVADLVDALASIPSADAQAPMAWLRPYARGGLWDGFFDRPKALLQTSFAPGQWWNFDLSTLRPENRSVVHAILTWFFYHAVTVGKQPMDIYIDEGWRLLRSGPFADLLDELGRRARKRGVGIVLVTHLPEDISQRATSLGMASTAFVGRMGEDDAYTLFRTMGMSEKSAHAHAQDVARLPPGVFLVVPSGGRSSVFPVETMLPPAWLKYWEALGAAK